MLVEVVAFVDAVERAKLGVGVLRFLGLGRGAPGQSERENERKISHDGSLAHGPCWRQPPAARNRNLQLGSSLPNVRIHDPEFASCTSALRRRVGEWRRLGYENAADNLERFLKGVGGTKTITREEARRFPVIREAEAKARHRFEGTSFLGRSNNNLLIHESHPAMSAWYGMGWVRAAL